MSEQPESEQRGRPSWWGAFWPQFCATVAGGLVIALVVWIVARYVSKIHVTWTLAVFVSGVVLVVSMIGSAATAARLSTAQQRLNELQRQALQHDIDALRLAMWSLMQHVMVDVINAATAEGIRYEQYEFGKSQPGWGFRFPDGQYQFYGALTSRDDVIRQLREAGASLEGL